MCCEECVKYEECAEEDRLRDGCCSKCQEYQDCAQRLDESDDSGSDDREEDEDSNLN